MRFKLEWESSRGGNSGGIVYMMGREWIRAEDIVHIGRPPFSRVFLDLREAFGLDQVLDR